MLGAAPLSEHGEMVVFVFVQRVGTAVGGSFHVFLYNHANTTVTNAIQIKVEQWLVRACRCRHRPHGAVYPLCQSSLLTLNLSDDILFLSLSLSPSLSPSLSWACTRTERPRLPGLPCARGCEGGAEEEPTGGVVMLAHTGVHCVCWGCIHLCACPARPPRS
jgi:hypothetical protein